VNRLIEVDYGRIVNELEGQLKERPNFDVDKIVSVLDPKSIHIELNESSLNVKLGEGRIIEGIAARLPFPLSYPNMVILYDSKGRGSWNNRRLYPYG
jgi:hypothetical protein